jgi:hypothetical protein
MYIKTSSAIGKTRCGVAVAGLRFEPAIHAAPET